MPTPALIRMTRPELLAFARTSYAAGQVVAIELQRRQQKRFQQYELAIQQAESSWLRLSALQKQLARL
jgi:hypothetical protein